MDIDGVDFCVVGGDVVGDGGVGDGGSGGSGYGFIVVCICVLNGVGCILGVIVIWMFFLLWKLVKV